jgi:hypothetical protein
MKLSAPVYRLKRNARRVSRQKKIPLIQALDESARQEGCESWSLLVARLAAEMPAARLFGQLRQGASRRSTKELERRTSQRYREPRRTKCASRSSGPARAKNAAS